MPLSYESSFVPEQLYHRRRDIHARFGGQEQGGIITPAPHKLVFLVTGNSGRQHGYDLWLLVTPTMRRGHSVQPHLRATSAQAILKNMEGRFAAWQNLSTD